MTSKQRVGACFCKAVELTVTGDPLFTSACHCTICQRMNGGPMTFWCGWPTTSLNITKGANLLTEFQSSDTGFRYFCSKCGSTVYSESRSEFAFRDAPVVLFERDANKLLVNKDFLPSSHIFYKVRVVDVVDNLPKWETYPGVGEPLQCDSRGVPISKDAVDDVTHDAKKAKTESTH